MKPISFVLFVEDVCNVKLTPGQRVLASVLFDGLDPWTFDGAERALARQIFGEVETIPDDCRMLLSIVAGRAASKSYLGALWLLWRSLTADVSHLAAGQVAVALVVAPRLKLAREVTRYARGAASGIRGLVIDDDTGDGFTVAREGGRKVSLEALPASGAGVAVRGRTFVAVFLDECAFFFGDDGHSVTDQATFDGITPRNEGPTLVGSSPWRSAGLLWTLHEQNYGHPNTGVAAWAPTTLLRPDSKTRAMVSREEKRDPDNARREFGAEFLEVGTSVFFDGPALQKTIDGSITLGAARSPAATYYGAVDMGFRNDASACVIVASTRGIYTIADIVEKTPSKGAPLIPGDVAAVFAQTLTRYGIQTVASDAFYIESTRENLLRHGIATRMVPSGRAAKAAAHLKVKELVGAGAVRVPEHGRFLVQQLTEIVATPTSGGELDIRSPRRMGSHGDVASAAILAIADAHDAFRRPALRAPGVVTRDFDRAGMGIEEQIGSRSGPEGYADDLISRLRRASYGA